MTEEEFSPEDWRKYKGDRTPLPVELQEEELKKIISVSEKVIRDAQRESYEEFGADYEIRGVVIYGSWADKAAAEESDVDIITLSVGDPADLRYEVAEHIEEELGRKVENATGENIDLNDSEKLKELLRGQNEVVGENFIVVTPYNEVHQQIDEIRKTL